MAGAASGLAPALFSSGAHAEGLNYDALSALRQVGLDVETSEVMSTASYMMDVLGPRLSGSPQLRKSADWVVGKLKGWGIPKAGLEAWPADPTGTNNGFPRGWANEKFYFHATLPERLSDLWDVDRLDAWHQGSGQRRMRADRRHGG